MKLCLHDKANSNLLKKHIFCDSIRFRNNINTNVTRGVSFALNAQAQTNAEISLLYLQFSFTKIAV